MLPPDEYRRFQHTRWTIFALLVVFYMMVYFHRMAPGVVASDLKAILADHRVWPGFWVNFGITGSLFAFAGLWGVPLMRDVHGLSRGEASLYTTAALAGFAVGTFFMGGLSDRLGHRKPVILGAAILQPLFGRVADLTWDGILIEGVRRHPWACYQNGLLVSAGFAGLAVVGGWFLRETHCRNQTLAASR